MATISFNQNINEYPSGKATIKKEEVLGNRVTLWFELTNSKLVRESYRLNYPVEEEKFKQAVQAILGEIPETFDTQHLVGKVCNVKLEERDWQEGRKWTGVANVTSWQIEPKTTMNKATESKNTPSVFEEEAEEEAEKEAEE